MNDPYINLLFKNIENTIIKDPGGKVFDTYSNGIKRLVDIFSEHKEKSSSVYFVGNGGSSSIASHMTADYMKNGGMITCSLYDNAVTTCMGNDYGYEYIFSKPLSFLMREGDLLVAISSSGNSQNIVNAIDTAISKGADVISLTGFEPNSKIRSMDTFNIYVPISEFGIVESIHTIILQQVVDTIAKRDGIKL